MARRTVETERQREEKRKTESARLTEGVNMLNANWMWRILANSNLCGVSKETTAQKQNLLEARKTHLEGTGLTSGGSRGLVRVDGSRK
ncbi:hypothetical protein INR49_024442 [Caranx melampygus]|nr:hypothetical protein INR49_024442 [Caranx melampygus]